MHTTAPGTGIQPLEVVDLTLPQQILLWALRHVTHCGEMAIRAGIGKVVGEQSADHAVNAFSSLSAAVSQSTLGDNAIPQPWALAVSRVEMDLMQLTALVQSGAAIALSVIKLPWVTVDRAETITAVVKKTAGVLQQAGERLPVTGTHIISARSAAQAPVLSLDALSDEETALLSAIRIWVHAAINRQPTTPPLLHYLTPRRMGSVAQPICAVLRNTATHATRLLDVHCPRCRSLSIDEARLLHAVGCAQRGQRFTVEKIVATWLDAPHSHKLAMDTQELGQRMLRLDISLPPRNWCFPELNGGKSSWQNAAQKRRSRTLH